MCDSSLTVCRLCGGELERKFELPTLGRLKVAYFHCKACLSLQTEPPYWLDEAYASSLAFLDTGAVQRNLTNVAGVVAVARLLRVKNIRDFGGGDGMLCRLLRDYGLNCFVEDKYAVPHYASKFTSPDFEVADVVLAFEVLEHLANPSSELAPLFAGRPKVVMASTLVYENQGSEWWYLAPEAGQHIFFFSSDALRLIAARFGYVVAQCGGFILFLRPDIAGGLHIQLLRLLLTKICVRLLRAVLSVMRPVGVQRDFDALRNAR